MKFALPLVLLASPAAAHTGVHLHPHGVEPLLIGLALIAVAGVAAKLAFAK
ncbi:hypothetical protein N6L24_04600 [Cognatishimia sp. SS12]|uniref:hypothetical protein n=1 Tax=Cognatishimia sp. SS12 TaxID=2979465 RepID=UPI00232B2BC3|nr:hypothetical protein [Cognatishimia sp. SS12]MDC0737546.1 hypothetical protein [Cognatishimia sp. SS12]